MALTITLTATANQGVNFNTYVQDYFSDFTFGGWPYILGGDGPYEGDELVVLDELEDEPRDTKVVVLDGQDFFYQFTGHTLSGTLETVRLSQLGDSYQDDGSFQQDADGHIENISTPVEISGLDISNPPGVKGDFHEFVSALMGTDSPSGLADSAFLLAALAAEAHNIIGSAKADTYGGTKFNDTVNGNGGGDTLAGGLGGDRVAGGAGNDKLSGGAGRDTLDGGAGRDTLDGGASKDALTGGSGADKFVFTNIGDSGTAATLRDTILDFDRSENDRINLSGLAADLDFAGTDPFSGGGAAEVRYKPRGANTLVLADTDGDKSADFAILLTGHFTLEAGDFIL